MILRAAGSRKFDILELLIDNDERTRSGMLQKALNFAAENGHENTCARLLSFFRNPQLMVTENMLIAVQYPQGLEIVLNRTSLEQGVVTDAVVKAMTKKIVLPLKR